MITTRSMKELVKRKDWQQLRKSMLGTWRQTPVENVQKLRKWLGPLETAEYDKLRIVMNYLTGTGFRTGRITHPEIQRLRDNISLEIQHRKEGF